jgi:hypothetical protein
MSKSKIVVSKYGISYQGRAVGLFRLNMILRGLKFEQKFPGARLTNKAPKCSTIVRREFGLKGNHAKLIAQFEPLVEQARSLVEVEVEA